MKLNIGQIDRTIRFMLSIIMGVLYFTNALNGVFAVILLFTGIILFLTSVTGFCPFYALAKIKTLF